MSQVAGEQLFDNSKIHEIRFTSNFESFNDTLTKNYVFSFGMGQMQIRKIPYAPAAISIDGTVLNDSVGVRHKGFNSWWSAVKKPIKVDLNEYKDQLYDGITKFNLHNGAGDPSFIRENISYSILRSLGVKAPRTAFAKVFVDDAYMGLYRIVEQIDNKFLDVNFGNHDGNLYAQQSKGSSGFDLSWIDDKQENYYAFLELENHEKVNDWSLLMHFLDVLNNADDASFKNEILTVFDVDDFLQVLAFDIAINNLDCYGNTGRNYYLTEVNGKIHWLPWDYNLSWREGASPIDITPEDYPVLINRILKVPEFYNSFLNKYCALISHLSSTSFNTLVDNEAAKIRLLIENDPFLDYPYEAFETNLTTTWQSKPGLKEFAAARVDELIDTFSSLHLDCDVMEVPEARAQVLEVYPIPAGEFLHVVSTATQMVEVTIINPLGQQLLQATTDETGSVDVHELPAGNYILKALIGSKTYTTFFQIMR